MWSRLAPACVDCGTTEKKHWARGKCKTCYRKWHKKTPAGKAERQRYARKYFKTEQGKQKIYNQKLREKYGITLEQKIAMLKAQGGVCAICEESPYTDIAEWHVDHDHNTGAVRGILCRHCNMGIGFLKDNIKTLEQASKYLQKYLPVK